MCLHLLLLCLSKMFSFTLWMQQFNRRMISSDSFMLSLFMFATVVDNGMILMFVSAFFFYKAAFMSSYNVSFSLAPSSD